MEQARLELNKEGKLVAGSEVSGRSVLLSEQSADNLDVVGNLRLLPKKIILGFNVLCEVVFVQKQLLS